MGQKSLPPRRKRMTRPQRLQSGRHWLATCKAKNVVRAYAKWFGVDRRCAVIELRLLGVAIDPAYADGILSPKSPARRAPVDELPEGYGTVGDNDFATIAGFTAGGAPYGTPWEE